MYVPALLIPAASPLNASPTAYLSRADGLVQTDAQGMIKSASIPRIVEQLVLWHRGAETPGAHLLESFAALTLSAGVVNEQRDCFLLCYKMYCTPRQLLDLIRSLYTRQKPAEVSDDTWRRHKETLRNGYAPLRTRARRSAANALSSRLADFIGRWLTLSYKTDFWSEDGTINYLLYEYLMETIELFPDDKSPGSPYKRLKDQLPKLAQDTPPSPKQATDRKKLKDSKGMRHTFSDLISKKLPRPEDIKFVDLHGTHASLILCG